MPWRYTHKGESWELIDGQNKCVGYIDSEDAAYRICAAMNSYDDLIEAAEAERRFVSHPNPQ